MAPEKKILANALNLLRATLPASATLRVEEQRATASDADAVWDIGAGVERTRIVVEAKRAIWPRDVDRIAEQLVAFCRIEQADTAMLVAPSLTRRTKELLSNRELNYLDLRGSVRIVVRVGSSSSSTTSREQPSARCEPRQAAGLQILLEARRQESSAPCSLSRVDAGRSLSSRSVSP